MKWVVQPGWVLTWNEYEEWAILAVFVANSGKGKDEVIRRLKEVAYRHRHPRGGKNLLEWSLQLTEWLGPRRAWKADGITMGSYYLIEPYMVEVLFDGD